MTTKKMFVELVEFLERNETATVADILSQVYDMTNAKQSSKNFIKDDNGNVTHVFCYYHKKWEPVSTCEYGSKKNAPSGLNQMCKEGVNQWTKQQRNASKASAELLDIAHTLSKDEIQQQREAIESQRIAIVPRKDEQGTDEMPV